ncbi:MAG: hypothetical protein ACYTFV_19215 [Planctomycetota bacterium]
MNDPALWLPIFTLVTAGLTALFLRLAMRALRRGRLVDDLPTSKTAGVFIGLVECHGTAESEAPFTSFLAEVRCVHHAWSVDEHWQRTVTETYTDSKGNTQTRTRTESGSTTVASGGESAPFWSSRRTSAGRTRSTTAKVLRARSPTRPIAGPSPSTRSRCTTSCTL